MNIHFMFSVCSFPFSTWENLYFFTLRKTSLCAHFYLQNQLVTNQLYLFTMVPSTITLSQEVNPSVMMSSLK